MRVLDCIHSTHLHYLIIVSWRFEKYYLRKGKDEDIPLNCGETVH